MSPLDLAYMERLCKGDPARMAEYIALYLQEAPGLFGALEAMAGSGDGKGLAEAAHALHPHVHYMGDAPLCALLQRVQARACTEGAGACAQDVEACLVLHLKLMQALHQWMAASTGKG